MGVFAGDDLGDEHQGRVEHHQTRPRQRTGAGSTADLQTLLGGSEMVAVEDPHPVTRQQRLARTTQFADEPLTAACDPADQFGGHRGLEVLEFLVDTLEGDGDTLKDLLIGRLDVRERTTSDQTHQVDGGGEQQFSRVPAFRSAFKQSIK
jgi:hypothetical protein